MNELITYIEEGFYKNTRTDVCGIINDHLVHSADTEVRFENDHGKYHIYVKHIPEVRNAKYIEECFNIDNKVVKFLYNKVTEDDGRVIYVCILNSYRITGGISRTVGYVACYANERDAFWGFNTKVIGRKFPLDTDYLEDNIKEGFYKNTKTDICGILNDHILSSIFEKYWFEQDRGKIYLLIDSKHVGAFGTFRNIRVEINKKDVDSIYKIVAGTKRVIYIDPTIAGVPNKDLMRIIIYLKCYENEHDVFWGGKVIERTFKTDKTLSSNDYEIDEGFYANTHTRVVDQLNDSIMKKYCMTINMQPNYYFTMENNVLKLNIRIINYSPRITYNDVELELFDTERDALLKRLQEYKNFGWRVSYQMLARDKYRIMLKVYDGDDYLYHITFMPKPAEMAKFRQDKVQMSLADFIK